MQKNRSLAWRCLAGLLAFAMVMVSGCGSRGLNEADQLAISITDALMGESTIAGEETADEEVSQEAVPGGPISSEKEIRLYTNTFTGEATTTDFSVQRPYVFVVNNFSIAMPLCGIAQADWVLEMPDENSITRMLFVYADPSGAEKIGSIREARWYHAEIAAGMDAILVHMSEDEAIRNSLSSYAMAVVDATGKAFDPGSFYYDTERQVHGVEHSLFAGGAYCRASAEGTLGYRTLHREDYSWEIPFYENGEGLRGTETSSITVTFAGGKTTSFLYDGESGTYSAFQYGGEILDNNETPVTFANVAALYANMYPKDEEGHMTMELTEGTGYFFTNGVVTQIRWYKDGLYDRIHLETMQGDPVVFNVGKTYLCITQIGGYQGSIEFE